MFSPQASALLALIRNEIQLYGQSVVGCEKLLVLVSDSDPIGLQFGHIFTMAERERWSIEFRNDGMVRFAQLESVRTTIEEWQGPTDLTAANSP